MIKLKCFFILLVLSFSFNVFSQAGIYSRNPKASNGTKIFWTLTLNQDGTFLYHFFRDISGEANPEENFYGKGTWVSKGKLVYFYANKDEDFNSKFTENLNNSTARYIIKSPRDKSDKIVKTALRFFESETSHIKGLELFKE